MHPYAMIPLLALLLGSALAGAVLARGQRMSASGPIAGMLGCVCAWALCEVMTALSPSADVALVSLRSMRVFTLLIGPMALVTVGELRPRRRAHCRRLARLAAGVAAPTALSVIGTPWFVAEALALDAGGFGYRSGPLAPLLLGLEAFFPFFAIWLLVSTPAERRLPSLPTMKPITGLALGLPGAVALLTHVVLPQLGYAAPRLGTLTMVLFGGWLWLASFWPGEGAISDSGFARAILDDLHDGVAVLRRDGLIRSVNASLSRLLGSESRRLIGRPIEDFLGPAAGDGEQSLREREAVLRADAGSEIPVAISTQPIRDRQGGMIGRVLVVRDLRPVRGLRRQLVASGRLAAIGELAAGIAHEVNNPIAFIQSNLNQLRHDYEDVRHRIAEGRLPAVDLERAGQLLESGPEHIERALEDIARVASIVREVRGFAHAGSGEYHTCDLNELVDGVLRLATIGLLSQVDVEREYADLPPLACSGQDLKQVFLSLIRRAALAVPQGGRIRVFTAELDGRVAVVIEDEGGAQSDAHGQGAQPKSLEAGTGEWNGLELGSCHHLVEQQGGELLVERTRSGGTRVSVLLRLQGDEGVQSAPAVEAAPC